MEIIDKETLKLLAQKYSDESMATAVIDVVMSNNDSVKEDNNVAEELLLYIRFIEGVRIRLKEIHWSTKSNFEHEQTDYAGAVIMSCEDEIAEAFMGVCGYKFVPGQIVPSFPQEKEYDEVLRQLAIATLNMIKKLMGDGIYIGVVNKLEDLYSQLNKMMYLSTQE